MRWVRNQDSEIPTVGSPLELRHGDTLVGSVYLLAQKWRAVVYVPRRRQIGKLDGKREAMRLVEANV